MKITCSKCGVVSDFVKSGGFCDKCGNQLHLTHSTEEEPPRTTTNLTHSAEEEPRHATPREKSPSPRERGESLAPPRQRRDQNVRNSWALMISCLALVFALAALAISILRNPLGRGLNSYDFSSPEAAARSLIEIQRNRDIKANIELAELEDGNISEEKSRTFEIHRTADFNDLKILFVSFTRKGKKIKRIESFEKDPESKLWLRKYANTNEVRKVNEQLAKEMEAWSTKEID